MFLNSSTPEQWFWPWDGAAGDIGLKEGGDLAFKAALSTADAGGTGWVTANVHSRGTVTVMASPR